MSIPITIESVEIEGDWKYDCKNTMCICGKSIYDVCFNPNKYSIISDKYILKNKCGHAFHPRCCPNNIKNCAICKKKTYVCATYKLNDYYL